MSVGRLIYIDLSNYTSVENSKEKFKKLQKIIKFENEGIQRFFIVGDLYKCNQNNQRKFSFEEA